MADIIMTGYIGAVTIAGVAAEYRDELIKKLPHIIMICDSFYAL